MYIWFRVNSGLNHDKGVLFDGRRRGEDAITSPPPCVPADLGTLQPALHGETRFVVL